jgi:flagellar hook-associated protein 3 FlgL
MVNGIDPSAERFLMDLGRIRGRAERAQAQLSSGLRITRPSDAPDSVALLVESQGGIDRILQIRQNMARVKLEADSGEQSLASAVAALDRAETTAMQGTSFGTSAAQLQTLSNHAQGVLEALVSLANTKVEGRFIFSGDSDQTPPYQIDLTQANGVTAYAGSASTRRVEDPSGTLIPVARDAQSVFDNAATQSAFAAVNQLRLALAAGDQTATANAVTAIRAARDQIARDLSFYGLVQNEVAQATEFSGKLELQLQTSLSNARDADLAEAAVELNRAQIQQEAALASRARLPRTSLFDYLG